MTPIVRTPTLEDRFTAHGPSRYTVHALAPPGSPTPRITPPGLMTIRTSGYVPTDATRAAGDFRFGRSSATLSRGTVRTFSTLSSRPDPVDLDDAANTRGIFGFVALRFSSAARVPAQKVDDDAQPTMLQRIFGSRISSNLGSFFTRRNSSRTSVATRSATKLIHRGPLSQVIADATRDLVPDHDQHPVPTTDRAPGTVSHRESHIWAHSDIREDHIRASTQAPSRRDFDLPRAPLYSAASAAAVHRALEHEWAHADAITRSIAVRALDVNNDDARAANHFFDVVDAFVRAYFTASDFVLGGTCLEERTALRESENWALDNFAEARQAFLQRQDKVAAQGFLAHAEVPKNCTLAANDAEARGVGGLVHAEMSDIAAEISRAKGGPFLVLMLARGVARTTKREAAWAKSILFPSRFRAPRPLCMYQLNRQLHNIHGLHVNAFRDAEREYRQKFEQRGSMAQARGGQDAEYGATAPAQGPAGGPGAARA